MGVAVDMLVFIMYVYLGTINYAIIVYRSLLYRKMTCVCPNQSGKNRHTTHLQ